jgi:hypothetical protein
VPLTHDLSKLPWATHTVPVSSTQCHSHRTCLNYQTPLTHDLSKLPCATHTRPVSSTLRHSHTTCLNYPAPLTHDLSPVRSSTYRGPVWSTRRHSHTCAGTCSLINFNSIYEDCWRCRYSYYLFIQRYCINVQVYLWSISVPNFTRLASRVHYESRNGKLTFFSAKPPYCNFIFYEYVTQIHAAFLSQLSRHTLFQGPKEMPLVSPRLTSFQRPPCYYALQYNKQYICPPSTSNVGMDAHASAPCWYQVGLFSCPCTNKRLKTDCLHKKCTVHKYAALADCFLSMNSKATFPFIH